MLSWAKKHVRHKHKDAAEEQHGSETDQSSEKKEGTGRKSSPEKKLGSERKTPSFARRFASIRKLAADRKSPEKGSRGKSKSPEKGLRAESRSPGTARKQESSDKIEPSRKESRVNESSSSVTQRHPSPDHRRSPRKQSLEGQEASLPPPISSPAECLSRETQPDLEQKPSEDANDRQTSQPTDRDTQADNQAGSAEGAGADEALLSASQEKAERCVTPDGNESPKSDHRPDSDLRSDPASRTVRETGSRNLHDLAVRGSEDLENTDRSAKSADADTVASEDISSSKVDVIVSDERTCEKETGVGELSDSTSHQYINNTSKEIMNGVLEESAVSDASERRSGEDLQTEGQAKEEEFAEPQQSTAADQRDAVLQLPEPLVASSENGVTQSSSITYIDNEDQSDNDQCSHLTRLENNGSMDKTNHLAEGSDSLKDGGLELPSAAIIKDNGEPSPLTSVSQKVNIETPSLMTDLPKGDTEPPDQGSDTKMSENESGSKDIDSTQETASQVDTPKHIEGLLSQCINDTPQDMEEPALGGISKEKTFKVTDSENENKSIPPSVISEESVLSSVSDTLKNDEISPPVPPSEPPDDIDVPPPLPESEPPEESEEHSPLPLKDDGLTITEKPPVPPKSDLLKYSVSKDLERPLPISPFSAFDEESETANLADAPKAQDDTEGKNQHIIPHASSSSNRKSVDLGESEPYSLDSSHSVADDKVQESLPSSLNTSCDSDAAIMVVPPSPARRLSRESDIKDSLLIVSQPSSMSASYDGSHKFTDQKPVSVSSGSSSAAVGGSLPSSPSVPHRSRRPHPVPAARSLQTLNTATPTKRTVTRMDKEEGRKDTTKESPESLREASDLEKHNEKLQREIPIPKPRKIISLNPFESDEDEEYESQETPTKQVPVPKPRKTVSLNPFESDDDEESEIPKLEKSKVQVKQFSGPIPTTSAKVAVIGKNPFDEDDDEMEENSFSPIKNTTGESEFRPIRSSSPATHSLSSSHSSLSPRHLNDSLASISSQSSKIANESISTNPFDEDDDYDDSREMHNGLIRETLSRKSFSVTSSSPLKRDIVRSSLPPSTRGRTGRKKRPAPLPPGFRPSGMSTSTRDQQLLPDISSSSRGGSTSSINQEPQRRDSISSISSLTLSPKKAPPPRPPPPKVKSNFMTDKN